MKKLSQEQREEKDMLESARYYTRDFWYIAENGCERMVAEFSDNPSVQDSVKEGDSLEGAIDDHMASCFSSVAWNYKMDPRELYQKVLNHILP